MASGGETSGVNVKSSSNAPHVTVVIDNPQPLLPTAEKGASSAHLPQKERLDPSMVPLRLTSGKVDIMRKAFPIKPSFVSSKHLTASDQLLDAYPQLMLFIKDIPVGVTLSASKASQLDQIKKQLSDVYTNQLKMLMEEQSYGDGLDAKLHGIILRNNAYGAIFPSLAALFGGGSLLAAAVKLVQLVYLTAAFWGFTAIASLTFIYVGKRVESHQDDLAIPVKKRKNISEAITGSIKLSLGYLEEIMALANHLTPDVVVTDKIVAELAAKVERGSLTANSSRHGVVQIIIANSEKIETS